MTSAFSPILLVMMLVHFPVNDPEPKPKPKLALRVGKVAREIQQHPIVPALPVKDRQGKPRQIKQFYFDVLVPGKDTRQIIVTYLQGMKIPTRTDRKIELKGSVRTISLGGNPGTKSSYTNEVLHLESWKYLD